MKTPITVVIAALSALLLFSPAWAESDGTSTGDGTSPYCCRRCLALATALSTFSNAVPPRWLRAFTDPCSDSAA